MKIDNTMEMPKEILWYGKKEPLPDATSLRAGQLTTNYETGNLRYIRIGDCEVLRMIYIALRDSNWGTIIPEISNEKIDVQDSSFHISYDSIYNKEDIHFKSHVSIIGSKHNQIIFEFDGEALNEFKTNRTGFCVLHPIEGNAGRNCEIISPDGENKNFLFPKLISPHQPMKNISKMSWDLGTMGKANIIFEGDIFEMEDQRNWTDYSYKTYCRPLELPFPYLLKKGDNIHQRITLKVESDQDLKDIPSKAYKFSYDEKVDYPLPKIGVGRRNNYQLANDEIKLLGKIGFDHYDVEVVFNESWQNELKQALIEAKELDLFIKLKVWFTENYQKEIDKLISVIGNDMEIIPSLLILESGENVTSDALLNSAVQQVSKSLPEAKIGAGTAGFFADLNRNRIKHGNLDFISYSMNPQVHAFDNLTFVENLKGQAATVETARSFADGKEIYINPVTFKIQKPPTAFGGVLPERLPEQIDARQMSLFGAGWTLGSIKYLAEAGANCVTYFETAGEKGIIQGDRDSNFLTYFHSKAGAVFPTYYVFREILKRKNARVISSLSSHPMEFEGLVLKENGRKTVMLANFTNKQIEVEVNGINPEASVKKLDEKTVLQAMFDNTNYENSPYCDFKFTPPITTIKMRPYAIVTIEG